MSEVDNIIDQRGNRYGVFKDQAKLSQSLMAAMVSHVKADGEAGWSKLSYSQRESLEMIQHKIARIINGDPNYDDSWIDIAGYAQLIADEIRGNAR